MTTWVTGSDGQIGRALCDRLRSDGFSFIPIPRNKNGSAAEAFWDFEDGNGQLPSVAPASIVHLAALTSAYESRRAPSNTIRANVWGLARFLEELNSLSAHPHVIATGTVTELLPFNGVVSESCDDAQPTFYEFSKYAQRLLLQRSCHEQWIDCTYLFLANVYGGISASSNSHRGFINACIDRAVKGQDLTHYFDGSFLRDFTHVDDVVNAIVLALKALPHSGFREYAIGTGVGTSMRDAQLEVARQVQEIMNVTISVSGVTPPLGTYEVEYRNAVVDATKFRENFGWSATIDLSEGITRTIGRLRSN